MMKALKICCSVLYTLFFINATGCGPKTEKTVDTQHEVAVQDTGDTTGFIKTDVDNTDTDSVWEGY